MTRQPGNAKAGPEASRRAVTLLKVAIMVPVIGGFSAFGVEMTMLHALQSDAQRAADAGALAVAGWMARQPRLTNLNFNTAFSVAQTTVDRNWVGSGNVTLATSDVVFGRASYNRQAKTYTWTGTSTTPNAVEVTVRRTTGSPSGPVPLLFARIIGRANADVSATAQAAIQGRGITVVVDNSPAMNDDSQLSSEGALGDMVAASPNGRMNLKQLWQGLGSPTYGNMTTWQDGSATMQTLTGNTSSILSTLGLTSVAYPATLDPGHSWSDYVSFVKSNNSASGYKNKYGLRTFFDYLNTMVSSAPFGATPQQPLLTMKEVVLHLADIAEQRGDQMGLYNNNSSDPHFEIDLTTDMNEIRSRMTPLVAGSAGNTHNLGAGINEARTGLNQDSNDPDGQGYILVISDGVDQNGNNYRSQVDHAIGDGYTVAALSVGYASRPGSDGYNLMDWIGTNGGGGHLHMPPNLGLTAADYATIDTFIANLVGRSHVAVLIK